MSASRRREKQVIVVLLLVLAAALIYAFFYLVDWREREVNRGYSQAAIANPFLAAKLFLERHAINSHYSVKYTLLDGIGRSVNEDKVPALYDTLVLINARGTINGQRFANVRQWVEDGGTLITSLTNPFIGRLEYEDELFQLLDIYVEDVDEEDVDIDLTNFIDEIQDQAEKTEDTGIDEKSEQEKADQDAETFEYSDAYMCGETYVELPIASASSPLRADFAYGPYFYTDNANWVWYASSDEAEGALIASEFRLGGGRVVVLRDASIWRNSVIQCHDHAYLLWSLSNPNGDVWFLENFNAPSLLSLLIRYLPYLLLACCLFIALGVWSALTRFGPVFTPRSVARRSLSEHIHASANFLWKNSRYKVLVSDLRGAIDQLMSRRVVAYERKSTAEKLEYIVAFTQLDASQIEHAMFKKNIDTLNEFVAFVKTLKEIKERL